MGEFVGLFICCCIFCLRGYMTPKSHTNTFHSDTWKLFYIGCFMLFHIWNTTAQQPTATKLILIMDKLNVIIFTHSMAKCASYTVAWMRALNTTQYSNNLTEYIVLHRFKIRNVYTSNVVLHFTFSNLHRQKMIIKHTPYVIKTIYFE